MAVLFLSKPLTWKNYSIGDKNIKQNFKKNQKNTSLGV